MPNPRTAIAAAQYFGSDVTDKQKSALSDDLDKHDRAWGDSRPGGRRIWPGAMISPYLESQGLPGDGQLPDAADAGLKLQLKTAVEAIAGAVQRHKARCIEQIKIVLKGDRVAEVAAGVYEGIVSGQHIFLYGTAGVGKTTLVKHLCEIMDVPYDRLDGQSDMADIHLMGGFLPQARSSPKFSPGPLLKGGNMVLLIDELPRIPASVSNILLQPMAERGMAFADLVEGGTRQVQLSPGFVLIGTGNPFHYGGMAQKNEAVFDRFGMGYDMPHPSNKFRIEMLKKRNVRPAPCEIWKEKIDAASPLTLADIRVACECVELPPEAMQNIIAISSLVSPAEYCRRVQWDDAFPGMITSAATPSDLTITKEKATTLWNDFHTRHFEGLVDEVVQEGSNPRGEEMMAQVARISALSSGRSTVGKDDVAVAAARCLRFRLKPHPSMEPFISEIINVATAVQLREPKYIYGKAISEDTWQRTRLHPSVSKETFAVMFNRLPPAAGEEIPALIKKR